MKVKKIMTICAAVFATLMIIGCSKKTETVNSFGFYEDLDEAKVIAKKQKKDILLAVTMEDLDDDSTSFRQNVLASEEFKSLLGNKFVGVNFDFGPTAYADTEVQPGATKEEEEAAEKRTELILKNMQFVRTLDVQYTPVVFILSADGYYVTQFEYSENFENAKTFADEINSCEYLLAEMKSLFAAVEKGSVEERMNALDQIYYKGNGGVTYENLFRQAPEIDKKNETGLVSKLYMEAVLLDCMNFYAVGDSESALDVLVKAAEGTALDPSEKQEAYYMAGYLLITAGSEDIDQVIEYFNLAIKASPDDERVPSIKDLIETISTMSESQEQENQ